MKNFLLIIFSFISLSAFAQPQEATLLGTWNDPSIPPTVFFDNAYNEIWGLAVNDSEIAVIGSTLGTHFIDVTDPTNPIELTDAYVAGAAQGVGIVHRDYHDLNGYLYIVCDEGQSTLQIVDISDLPNSTTVVYDSNDILRRSHNVFIDSTHTRLYSCGTTSASGSSVHLQIIDISDPSNPEVLNSYSGIPYVHDVYVVDNIAYANCGNQGFFVVDFTDVMNPVVLGSMTTYPQQGYNHSGWLDDDGDHYYLADETWDMDMKVVDVSDFNDMSVISTFNADQTLTTIPHNLIVRCNRLYVSYYYDGLQVYDISDPTNPIRIYNYATSTRPNSQGYEGAWGVYPFLPSGNILVSDMQNGLFVLDAISEHTCEVVLDANTPEDFVNNINVFPQPAIDFIKIELQATDNQLNTTFELVDITGRTVQVFANQNLIMGNNELSLELSESINSGMYFLNIAQENWSVSKKIIIGK